VQIVSEPIPPVASNCNGRSFRSLKTSQPEAREEKRLIESEPKLTSDDGLPRRPWYKNLLEAPGAYMGYDAKTIPGVREGMEQKRYAEADQEIVRVAKALQDEASLIESAAQILEQMAR
jgi:N-acetylated-alpha-linked acidic dipeptidase